MKKIEFDVAISRTRLKDRGINSARFVLVDGLSMSAAARAVGMSPQAVRQAVRVVREAHKKIIGCNKDWACLTVCVPEGEPYDSIKEIERKELIKAGLMI